MRNFLRRLLGFPPIATSGPANANEIPIGLLTSEGNIFTETGQARTRVTMMKAVNGTLLEVAVYRPNPRGPDWTSTIYIVPAEQPLAEAVATALVLGKGDEL